MVIEGGGVTLRPWEPDDVAFVFDACQDPEIQRWTTVPRPYTAAHAVGFLRATRAWWADGSAYAFAIASTDTSELLGSIAVKDIVDGVAEIGYWVAPEARGRGAASAALDVLARWVLAELAVDEVFVRIAGTNAASLRVAARAGFRPRASEAQACPDGDLEVPGLVLARRLDK